VTALVPTGSPIGAAAGPGQEQEERARWELAYLQDHIDIWDSQQTDRQRVQSGGARVLGLIAQEVQQGAQASPVHVHLPSFASIVIII